MPVGSGFQNSNLLDPDPAANGPDPQPCKKSNKNYDPDPHRMYADSKHCLKMSFRFLFIR